MATMLNSMKRYNENSAEKSLNLDDLPKSVNADKMTDEELREKLRKGIISAMQGHAMPAREAFARLRAKYQL